MIGSRVRSIAWKKQTNGGVPFVADLAFPGLLIAAVVRSPHPHAEILSIDAAATMATPGVVAVLTAKDFTDQKYPHEIPDRLPLAKQFVRFVGEEVAVVVAESMESALRGVDAMVVRYRVLPAIMTVQEALAPDAPRIHERMSKTNVSLAPERTFGDMEAARAASAHVVRSSFRFNRQTHACMETNGSVAWWHPDTHLLEVWPSTQSPYFVRKEMAVVLGLSTDEIIIREVGVGGGFGSKSKITDQEALAGAASIKTGRPVRLTLSRFEEFSTTKCRHDFIVDLESGVTADGKLTFRDARMIVDNGAYNHSGPSVTGASMTSMSSLYRTDAVHMAAQLVDTDKHPGGQFRGYGGPQVTFPIESEMDELAEAIGMDPMDLRLANVNRDGDVTHSGFRLGTARLGECLEAVRDGIDWDAKRQLKNSGRGVGVGVAIHVSGARTYPDANHSEAAIDIGPDGRVQVHFGGSDAGTGQRTLLAQIAAQELGVGLDDIDVEMMDTEHSPFDLGAWSSRGTMMGGHAVGDAARNAAAKLRALATSKFDVSDDEVELRDGLAVSGDQQVPIGDLVGLGDDDSGFLHADGEVTLDIDVINMQTGVANISAAYAFAAQAAEVEVDRRTGKVTVLQVVAAHDCGTAINPVAAESQVVGGVVMGLGAALGEQLIYEGGRLVNPTYLHYAMPRAADAPPIKTILIEHPDDAGPYGAKSIGEISIDPIAGAIANAVYHAVGVEFRELPITPDKVLAGLRELEHAKPHRYHLWRRPSLWWIAFIRWGYPRGIHTLLHRVGTELARPIPPRVTPTMVHPTSISEAAALLRRPRTKALGGGTDIVPLAEQGISRPSRLIDLSGIAEIHRVWEEEGDLCIGGGVTLADLAASIEANDLPALRAAIITIASPQIREMATVAGNLCQEKRCWFYRNGFMCYKRGGATCPCYAVMGDSRYYHAVLGAHRCQAVTPSDLATVFTALDAVVHVEGKKPRDIPMEQFYAGPGETALLPGDVVTYVRIPREARARRTHFRKLGLWQGDFAVVSSCISLAEQQGSVSEARVVLGAIAPTPYRATDVERQLVGHTLDQTTIVSASAAWVERAFPLARNAWKVDAMCGLARTCLEDFLES